MAWFYRNCLTDTCNCNRGGDCECLCTSIAAYAHKCCQQGVTIHWRSPSVCREYKHTHIQTSAHSTLVYSVLVINGDANIKQFFNSVAYYLSAREMLYNFSTDLFQPMIVNTIIKVCMAVSKSFWESYFVDCHFQTLHTTVPR